jgi:hypothetical protein
MSSGGKLEVLTPLPITVAGDQYAECTLMSFIKYLNATLAVDGWAQRKGEWSRMYTQTIFNPHYGPNGATYQVVAGCGDRSSHWWYHTKAQALDKRDELLEQGWLSARVVGLPTTIGGTDHAE